MPGLGEFELIERFFTRESDDPAVALGVGDDAALIDVTGRLAVAVDTLVAGTHFPASSPARSIGHRALAVNLSDLAAMGSVPRWFTLALTIPSIDERWLDEFAGGLLGLADRYSTALIGGDTTRGPLTVTVQVIGELPDRIALTRGGGRPGDDLYISGTLGDAAAAIALGSADGAAATDVSADEGLSKRFRFPEPRVELGIALRTTASAAIDVSDGLLADLGHVCEASGCGARVDLENLPLSPALIAACGDERARRHALTGGDDYELCFAAARESADAVLAAADSSSTPVTRIGRLVADEGVTCWIAGQPVPIENEGFRHF
jgi:thiamine-monophosphate kinase